MSSFSWKTGWGAALLGVFAVLTELQAFPQWNGWLVDALGADAARRVSGAVAIACLLVAKLSHSTKPAPDAPTL